MRNFIALIAVLQSVVLVNVSFGQGVELLSKETFKKEGLESFYQTRNEFEEVEYFGDYYVHVQFKNLPTTEETERARQKSIRLLSYLSDHTYLAAIPATIKKSELEAMGIISVAQPAAAEKVALALQEDELPEWATREAGMVDVAVSFVEGVAEDEVEEVLSQFDLGTLRRDLKGGQIIEVSLPKTEIQYLAEIPLVNHIDIVQEPVKRLNHENCAHQRVNVLNSTTSSYGRNLNGEGVLIGVGDGGELGNHIDFGDRVHNMANGTYSSFGAHGDHVAGIIGSGGNLNPRHRGMASKASLLTQKTSLVTFYTPDYVNDHGMVLTNNSYGTSFNCLSNGAYNYTSNTMDWQMNEHPNLLHVFAAGNSGGSTCAPYPTGYRTVLRYYQASKNVLTVGSVDESREIWISSSRGPVEDGRIKPEICGVGTQVLSTGREYDYWVASGTSMAAPSVTGTLALLYERYRQLNNAANPEAALIKAVACNTAEDLGNTGPDYTYGFGLINARRAIETIEENRYQSASVATGESNTHTIDVPAGTRQVKVMLYWSDKEAEAYPTKALVNDLDLKVISSQGNTYLPWVLNIDPERVADLPTRQIDTLNNIEQVTIDNPAAGSYTLQIDGRVVPFGPQKYYLTYEFIGAEVVLTFPYGEEKMIPGNAEMLSWDAAPNSTGTFTLEYSIDNGANWELIAQGLPATHRSYSWTVPQVFTAEGKIRVSNSGGESNTNSAPFQIMEIPDKLVAQPHCNVQVKLHWDAMEVADTYEVYMFNKSEMVSIGTTVDTFFIVRNHGLTNGERAWFAVSAHSSEGVESRRTVAVSTVPTTDETCPWSNDPKMTGIKIDEQIGRYGTVMALTEGESIVVQLKNVGNNAISDFSVFYQVNDQTPVEEVITTTIPSGDTLNYTFRQGANLSGVGTHNISTWVVHPEDENFSNDTLHNAATAIQLDNNPIQFPLKEALSNIPDQSYTQSVYGLDGLENWDYISEHGGLLRVYNGSFYLEPVDLSVANPVNSVMATLNLSAYQAAQHKLILKFNYAYEARVIEALSKSALDANTVYVRGSDTDSWLELYNMDDVSGKAVELDELDVSEVLRANDQDFSSSFQIKFSQGYSSGITLSGITLYQGALLPVDIESFSVVRSDEDAVLKWVTGSEQNSDYFELQMARGDAIFQDNSFETIGIVEAIGHSNELTTYTFVDTETAKSGHRYYRIKSVDLDGSFEYSNVRVVQFDSFSSQFNFYPNPFYSEVNFVYKGKETRLTTFILTDQLGRIVKQFEYEVQQHENINIDFGKNLSAGTYMLHIVTETDRKSYPIVKQRL